MPRPRSYEEKYPFSRGEVRAAPAPTLRDAVAWWLADVWYGNDREGMQKAHRATNWLEAATPLGLATAADDVREPAMRGDYADAALAAALAFPPVKGLHITPREFRRFDMKKVLKGSSGTGVQNQGVGHYFMEPDNPSRHMYGDIFTYNKAVDKQTGEFVDSGEMYRDLLNFIDKELPLYSDKKTEIADRALFKLRHPSGAETEDDGFIPKKLLDYGDSKYATTIAYPNQFEVNLHVGDPLQLPQYYEPLDKQPDSVKSLMSMLAEDAYNPREMWLKTIERPESPPVRTKSGVSLPTSATRGGYQTHLMWPTGASVSDYDYHPTRRESENAAMAELDKLLGLREEKPVALVSQYRGNSLKGLYDQFGLPGHRYFDPESGGGVDPNTGEMLPVAGDFHNYVVTDDSKIEVVRKGKYKPKELMIERTFPDLFGPDIDLLGGD